MAHLRVETQRMTDFIPVDAFTGAADESAKVQVPHTHGRRLTGFAKQVFRQLEALRDPNVATLEMDEVH